jgi:DNA-binding MarR family transcriptional regulator
MHRQLQQDCELSLSDYDVLVALSEGGPRRVNELGDALGWEQSRVSHQLRRMRGRGLVVRHGSDDDRRGAVVELTPDGRAALEAAAPGHAELVRAAMFDGVPPTQLRALASWIELVTSRLH